MNLSKIIALAVFVGSCVWCYAEPGFKPALAMGTSLLAFIGTWAVEKRRAASQIQEVSVGGIGIQAGRDAKVGKIDKHDRN